MASRLFAGCSAFLSPSVHIAQWAGMHRFLSVRLSVTFDKNSYLRKLRKNFVGIPTLVTISLIALTGRAHCQCQVAFFFKFHPFITTVTEKDLNESCKDRPPPFLEKAQQRKVVLNQGVDCSLQLVE